MNEIKNNYQKYSYFFNITDQYKVRITDNIKFGDDISNSQDLEVIMERLNKKYTIPKYLNDFCKSKSLKFIYSKSPNPKGIPLVSMDKNNSIVIYLNCSNILFKNKSTNKLECRDDSILLHYLYSSIFTYSILKYPNMFLRKSEFVLYSTKIYSNLFTYVYEYLYKLSSNLYSYDKLKFLSCLFFQHNILGIELNDAVRNSSKISGLSNQKIIDGMMMRVADEYIKGDFSNFFKNIKDIIDIRKEVELSLFVEKYMSLYGEGTQFMLELISPFIDNITAISDNIFVNNKTTIEKIGEASNIYKLSMSIKSVLSEIYS